MMGLTLFAVDVAGMYAVAAPFLGSVVDWVSLKLIDCGTSDMARQFLGWGLTGLTGLFMVLALMSKVLLQYLF